MVLLNTSTAQGVKFCGLYYKPIMIANDDSRVINKLETPITDDASVIIYNHHMFIVPATDLPREASLLNT